MLHTRRARAPEHFLDLPGSEISLDDSMDAAYYTWLIFGAVGLVLGMFLHPRVILKVGAALLVLDAVGFAVAAMNSSTAIWSFGIGAMAIPILTAVMAFGAYVMRALTGRQDSE